MPVKGDAAVVNYLFTHTKNPDTGRVKEPAE